MFELQVHGTIYKSNAAIRQSGILDNVRYVKTPVVRGFPG